MLVKDREDEQAFDVALYDQDYDYDRDKVNGRYRGDTQSKEDRQEDEVGDVLRQSMGNEVDNSLKVAFDVGKICFLCYFYDLYFNKGNSCFLFNFFKRVFLSSICLYHSFS